MILHHHLLPFIFYVGLVNAYSVGQIITAHLTKAHFPYQNVLMLPLLFGILDSFGPWLQSHIGIGWPSSLGEDVYQVSFVFMSLGIAIGIYGSFVVDVIVAICDYLDIWCLTIKHPWTGETDVKSAAKEVARERGGKRNETDGDLNSGPSMRLRSNSKKRR